MKVAVLIMAHDQPNHLARLVDFLDCDWIRIFVHVDRKADIAEFQKTLSRHKNIIFLEGSYRVKVNWGGFSQVRAILNLLEVSLNFGERFTRFCLLSGSDFPIKTLDDIKSAFDSDREFVHINRRIDTEDAPPLLPVE